MTDIHKLAEEAARECWDNPNFEDVRIEIERAIAKLQAEHEAELATVKELLRECLDLADNWPGIAYTADLEKRALEVLK